MHIHVLNARNSFLCSAGECESGTGWRGEQGRVRQAPEVAARGGAFVMGSARRV